MTATTPTISEAGVWPTLAERHAYARYVVAEIHPANWCPSCRMHHCPRWRYAAALLRYRRRSR